MLFKFKISDSEKKSKVSLTDAHPLLLLFSAMDPLTTSPFLLFHAVVGDSIDPKADDDVSLLSPPDFLE